jgi:hypothetical protein
MAQRMPNAQRSGPAPWKPLIEIGSGPPAPNTSCPPDHPGRVGIFATISATEPGTKQYDGSRISATICADQDDFFLADGSQFTFYKK